MTDKNGMHWSGRLGFILATAGSAVGLGNIWKFPYITGINGGGAFVLAYLICIALIGFPILIAELYLGQASQSNAVDAFIVLDKPESKWRFVGIVTVASAFLILSFYSVVGGWILDFLGNSIIGHFRYGAEEEVVTEQLGKLLGNPSEQIVWHTVFMTLTVAMLYGGVRDGLEKWAKILMPALLTILVGLFLWTTTLSGFTKSIEFMFEPNFSQLGPDGLLEAVGHSFFTLSIATGAILTYGSYLERSQSIVTPSVIICILDTVVALISGVTIFAVVFSFGLEAAEGPGLIFSTLPMLFSKLTTGYLLSILFFTLVAFAALSSSVSLLEVIIAYVQRHSQASRHKIAILVATVVYLVGFLNAFSTNVLGEFKIFGLTFFDLFDHMTSRYMLPIAGLCISLFYGWKLGRPAIQATLKGQLGWKYTFLLIATRFLGPIGVGATLINSIIH